MNGKLFLYLNISILTSNYYDYYYYDHYIFKYSYRSILLELREDDEIRDFQQYFSIIFKGCVEEANDSKGKVKESGRKKIRKGTEKDLYYSARKSEILRNLINEFFTSISDIGDAMRFGESLKVIL